MKMNFDLHENEPVGETHFQMNGLAQRLVLRQKQWTIGLLRRCAGVEKEGVV